MQAVIFIRRCLVYLAVFAANLLSFSAAVTQNWSATIVPHLNSNNTSINPLPKPLTTLESSWIVAVVLCGCTLGPICAGIALKSCGRKKAILILEIPYFLGHIIIAFANQVWMFLLARFIMGVTLGASFGVMASYIGDIAEDKNRGLLGSFTTVFMSIGGLSVYVIGPYIPLRLFSFIYLIPSILLFTLFGLLVPETPYDLLKKKSIQKAKESLAFYLGKSTSNIENEFKRLLDRVTEYENEEEKKLTTTEVIRNTFKDPVLSRGIKLVGSTSLLQVFSGMGAVASYYQTIFEESNGSLDSVYCVMIIGVVTMFSTMLASQLVERLGRKLLLFIGFFFMAASLFGLGTYFFLDSKGHDTSAISWLPLVSLMVFTIAYNIQGSIPWILLTDIFPSNLLDVYTTIISVMMFGLAFILTLCFPYLNQALGSYGSFFLFGSCTGFATIYTSLFIPETKGMSIEEVQEMLKRK